MESMEDALHQTALILILDVRTRWSSTHQMLRMSIRSWFGSFKAHIITHLGRALDYHKVIDDFVAKTRKLRQYKLTSDDWNAIQLVYHWLKAF